MINKLTNEWNELQKRQVSYDEANKKEVRWNEEVRILRELQRNGCRECPAGMMIQGRDMEGMNIQDFIKNIEHEMQIFKESASGQR
jgi:hypothetical protein